MSCSSHSMAPDNEMRYARVQTTRPRQSDKVDDAVLVSHIKQGDHLAMETLYLRYVHKVTGIAAKLLRHSADIEDVVQDTFIAAFRDMAQLNEPQFVERWLVRIAIHRVHRRFRRRTLKRALGLDRSIDDERLVDQVGVAAPQEARAEIALLDSALNDMGMKERTCFVLRYLEGYRLEEVARLSGCSLATVKRRIATAKRVVDRHFEEENDG